MEISILKEFNKRKLVIGMVHLGALPGSPDFKSLDLVIKNAIKDAKNLQTAGFDAIMIENFGDVPFYMDTVPVETVAAFTFVAGKISDNVKLPLGINVLRNDGFAALAIANTIGANFIRINVLISAALTDQGIIQGRAAELVRFRERLNKNIAIFADVSVKHSYPLTGTEIDLTQEVKEAYYRGKADAIILSGKETGSGPDYNLVKEIREKNKKIPFILGSGANLHNINQYKRIFDAIIVGTSIKKGNITTNPVDLKKAKAFIKKLKK